MQSQGRHYTLVELLVTMAIIGVLLSIGMPAFEKIAKGNKVTAATNNLGGAFGLARSQAILTRKYVAIVLPTANLTPNHLFKSYRLCYIKTPSNSSATTFEFDSWLGDNAWKFFPDGVIIADADQTAGYQTAAWPKNLSQINNVDCSDLGQGTKTLYGVIFTPYGNITPLNDLYVLITEGSNDGSTVIFTNRDASNKPANYLEIILSAFTGRASYRG